MGNGLPVRLGMALVLAATAACSDDDDPTGPVDALEQLVARSSRGTIDVLDTEGNVLGEVDDTFTGPEQALLDFDALPSEPDYFIVVYSYDGDDSGSYTLDVGPVDEP